MAREDNAGRQDGRAGDGRAHPPRELVGRERLLQQVAAGGERAPWRSIASSAYPDMYSTRRDDAGRAGVRQHRAAHPGHDHVGEQQVDRLGAPAQDGERELGVAASSTR